MTDTAPTREEFDDLKAYVETIGFEALKARTRIDDLETGAVRRTEPRRPNPGLESLHDRLLVAPDAARLEDWPVGPERDLPPETEPE